MHRCIYAQSRQVSFTNNLLLKLNTLLQIMIIINGNYVIITKSQHLIFKSFIFYYKSFQIQV